MPSPSPRPAWGSPQARPLPDSSSAASTVQAVPAGTVRRTGAADELPASSAPATAASASASVGLARRSRLTWRQLLPGLKVASARAPSAALGAVPSSGVRKPSAARA